MNQKRLSERMRIILSLLRVYGPQPTSNLIQIVFPGQRVYLGRQTQYLLRTLHGMEDQGLIEKDVTGLWKITEKGKNI